MLNFLKQLVSKRKGKRRQIWGFHPQIALISASSATAITIGMHFLGWLQPLELRTLDAFFQLRPPEITDRRITLVEISEADIQKIGRWPVSDRTLALALTKIKARHPAVIGLDIYRNIPEEPGHSELVSVFKSTPNLIGIEKTIGDSFNASITAPPVLKQLKLIAASDVVVDEDSVVRRAILFPYATSADRAKPSLGLKVALFYLEKEKGITPTSAALGWMKLGKTVFLPLQKKSGGYVRADTGGYQILLNYRGYGAGSFVSYSLSDVLENRVPPSAILNRIVLIGTTASSINDKFYTPYSNQGNGSTPIRMPGVEIHANLASQILSSVLDNRPLILTLPLWAEYLRIAFWVGVAAIWMRSARRTKPELKFLLIATAGVSGFTAIEIATAYFAFLLGWWIPAIAPAIGMAIVLVAAVCFNYIDRLRKSNQMLIQLNSKLEEHNRDLDLKVKERTQEVTLKNYQLKSRNSQLSSALDTLKATQKKIIAQQKLAELGTLTAGVAHEIQNPLNFVNNYANLCSEYSEEILELIPELNSLTLSELSDRINEIAELVSIIYKNATVIKESGNKASNIVRTMLLYAHHEKKSTEPTKINELIDSAIKLVYHSQKNESGVAVQISTDFDDSIEDVEISRQDITRAFVNLLNNAYYAVCARKKEEGEEFVPKISVTTENRGDTRDEIIITITDNGTGIPKDITDKIFTPFFTTKAPGEGTGLGLSLTNDIIVGQHQGEIKVEDASGGGTIFTIILPKNQEKEKEHDNTTSQDFSSG